VITFKMNAILVYAQFCFLFVCFSKEKAEGVVSVGIGAKCEGGSQDLKPCSIVQFLETWQCS